MRQNKSLHIFVLLTIAHESIFFQFANTAKRMKNTPKVNEVLDDDALLKRYRKEILDLKKQLEEVRNNLAEVNLSLVLIAIGNTPF